MCRICGEPGHSQAVCEFKDKACSLCGEVGHLKAMCKQATKKEPEKESEADKATQKEPERESETDKETQVPPPPVVQDDGPGGIPDAPVPSVARTQKGLCVINDGNCECCRTRKGRRWDY
eukprot:gnl/TRDRNA2_/TRDRNA2_173802_c5_seq5.p2 gnl/TRDRNA2_/TRDRNA2_173802_c5~~gnl/TRDRNA2_/TRDRNA2_173802_c5_seq5.p2  ORF type:complete len:120 (+),score=27.80 gnl/TRDRNA2_/TRDRNA2_173802_c5_seq5:125-484(+)